MPEPVAPVEVAQVQAKPDASEYDLPDSRFHNEIDLPVGATESQSSKEDAKAPPGPSKQFTHPKTLSRLAASFGIPQSVIDATEPAALDDMVADLHDQQTFYARGRQDEQQQYLQSLQQRGQQQAEEQVNLGITEADYDPNLLGVIKNQAKELSRIRRTVEEVSRRAQNAENVTGNAGLVSSIDRLFATTADDLFGTAPVAQLSPASPEFRRRMAVVREMENHPGSLDQRYEAARDTLYGASTTSRSAKQLSERREKWDGAALARTTSRRSQEPKGELRAARAIAAKMKAMDYNLDGGEGEEATLPS